MPTARTGLSLAAGSNGKLYAMGGGARRARTRSRNTIRRQTYGRPGRACRSAGLHWLPRRPAMENWLSLAGKDFGVPISQPSRNTILFLMCGRRGPTCRPCDLDWVSHVRATASSTQLAAMLSLFMSAPKTGNPITPDVIRGPYVGARRLPAPPDRFGILPLKGDQRWRRMTRR